MENFINLKIRVNQVSDYFSKTRDIKIGDTFQVLKVNRNLGKNQDKTGYLIESINGKYLTFYDNEVTVERI